MKKLVKNVLLLLILPILPFFSSKSISKESVPNSVESATTAENQTSVKEGRALKVRAQIGIASWCAHWHGKKTASGEHFNMYDHTAAHKSLPLGTVAKVTNLENGKRVIVKINDRGPYKKGRIIDLSHAAAKSIGMLKDGTAKVKVEVIAMPREKGNLQASNRS
ncbi:MAG: septal ring lytic transglycosylase RlpA family protein [Ignavibacteriales bacterium]